MPTATEHDGELDGKEAQPESALFDWHGPLGRTRSENAVRRCGVSPAGPDNIVELRHAGWYYRRPIAIDDLDIRKAVFEAFIDPEDDSVAEHNEAVSEDISKILRADRFSAKQWTASDLLEHHEYMTSSSRSLMERKNHDYAGSKGLSPFANFETSEQLGVCSTETGILVRLLDKVKRLANFIACGELKVSDEKIDDTLQDLINYAIIESAWLRQKQGKGPGSCA